MHSTTPNRLFMEQARDALRGKLGSAAGAYFLFAIILSLISAVPYFGTLSYYILSGPFVVGFYAYTLRIARSENVTLGFIFDGFNDFGRCVATFFLILIYTLLWSLLLIIPGIMASFSYTMTYFILIDNPDMKANEAIKESKRLMMGNRWKLFCLGFRFIGWYLLGLATVGIGFFWIVPYFLVTLSNFYEDIKEKNSCDSVNDSLKSIV